MAIKKRPVSPRQKMINLMYVVLMAMLALNVSNEVLNGFSIVEESLKRTTINATNENLAIYDDFAVQMKKNPQKVKQWYDLSEQVKTTSNKLYNLIDELKLAIVIEADGKDGNVSNLRNKEDLEAANQVMLAPGRGRGQELYDAINAYRAKLLSMVTDVHQKKMIVSNLTTEVPESAKGLGKNWQEYMFESMPAAAAVTLLSKLQNDLRYAEGEVLHTLVSNIDVKDIRVNALNAFVIPNSQTIVRGDKFSARIVMAAVDTTQQPQIFIGGKEMNLPTEIYCGGSVGHRVGRPHERAVCRLLQPAECLRARRAGQQGTGHHERWYPAASRSGSLHCPSDGSRPERHHYRHQHQYGPCPTDGTVHVPCAPSAGPHTVYRHERRWWQSYTL